MIIVDERNFLGKELEAHGFEVFDFYENHLVLDMKSFSALELKRRSDFLLVDTQTVLDHPEMQEAFKAVLNTFLGAVFFHDHRNEKAQEWVKSEGAFLSKIIGEYALPMSQLHWTILSNQLQFFFSLIEDQKRLQKGMVKLSLELDELLQNAQVEMQKAKRISEVFVPRRKEEIKGVTFVNKYAAGEGGGVEFYDLHQTPGKIYQILVSTDSYLMSSSLLGLLGQHRESDFSPTAFLEDAKNEIQTINEAKKKKSKVDLLLLELDLSTLELSLLTDSEAELYSQDRGKLNLARGSSCSLNKGEKVVVFSPGFLFNWRNACPEKNRDDFIKEHKARSSHELISELFIELKGASRENFLNRDATVVMMEVNRHGIHKV